jgi:hypothetical protein
MAVMRSSNWVDCGIILNSMLEKGNSIVNVKEMLCFTGTLAFLSLTEASYCIFHVAVYHFFYMCSGKTSSYLYYVSLYCIINNNNNNNNRNSKRLQTCIRGIPVIRFLVWCVAWICSVRLVHTGIVIRSENDHYLPDHFQFITN